MTNGPDAGVRPADGPAVPEFSATWTPGSTDLTGTCFCGARHQDPDPVAMWDWLDGHPQSHHAGPDREGGARSPTMAGPDREGGL
ncbi:hypothetical protein GCM10022225_26130 [Plantactinospora mayteni]|uniref:Uncharacterized protein n=1 Tax=Plantactinospora mayteni TaxID=566021 RepID=A0ABQ4EIU1_9ACTN|nr:hypothetical protein [Plantactinospora mayteni]GIG94657.1 hypothetical protein Pma05_12300 [Plantactinospora mayteni]